MWKEFSHDVKIIFFTINDFMLNNSLPKLLMFMRNTLQVAIAKYDALTYTFLSVKLDLRTHYFEKSILKKDRMRDCLRLSRKHN